MKAMISENTMAALAPTGMGRMYGPISPPTKAMGTTAKITANVARIVGLPTSLTASTATSRMERPSFSGRSRCRTMFSTTTMASSTRMPMLKISANSVMRFSVKPYEVKHEEREREGGGDGDGDHEGLAPAEREQDQQRHAQHREPHVEEQFVGFLGRRLAVVARDAHGDIGGNDRGL